MANEVRVPLTDAQKAKIKAATGKDVPEIRVESFGGNSALSAPASSLPVKPMKAAKAFRATKAAKAFKATKAAKAFKATKAAKAFKATKAAKAFKATKA